MDNGCIGQKRYSLCWECYDFGRDTEYVKQANFDTKEEAEQFVRNNAIGCWWIRDNLETSPLHKSR